MLLDFSAFWTAGKLALAGEPMVVWDKAAFQAALETGEGPEGSYLPWFYPPTFHMLVTPFGALPFPLGFGLWSLLGAGLFWLTMRHVNPGRFTPTVVAPAIFLALAIGNNALLFGAALALALTQIQRPVIAGLAISLLSLKPGLGPVIALALLAGRRWSIIVWASLGSLGLAAAATAIFGFPYWLAFLDSLEIAVNRITPQAEETRRMISWFAFARLEGWEREAASALHIGIFVTITACTMFVWSLRGISHDWQCAALCLAVALTSPHAFHYEMVYSLVAIAFMIRGGLGPVGWLLCGLLWLGPIVQVLEPRPFPITSFAAPLLTTTFAYVLLRALRG
ncbi:MAG: glycosyltransferase family 87 protein [Pseudomonadota bacterium]